MPALTPVGNWTLIAAVALDANGQVVGPLFGANPQGQLHYGEDGTLAVTLTAGGEGAGRTPWGQAAPRDYVYSGTYRLEGHQVHHQVTHATDAGILGRVLRRVWQRQDDELHLSWRLPHGYTGHMRWRVAPAAS